MKILEKELTEYVNNKHTQEECTGFSDGFEAAVRAIKKYSLKDAELPEFDESKKDDPIYCVEWGMKKAQLNEFKVWQKMLKELL